MGKRLGIFGGIISQVPADSTSGGATEEGAEQTIVVDASSAKGVSGGGVFREATGCLLGIVEGYQTASIAVEGRTQSYSVKVPMPGETFAVPIGRIRRFVDDAGLGNGLGRVGDFRRSEGRVTERPAVRAAPTGFRGYWFTSSFCATFFPSFSSKLALTLVPSFKSSSLPSFPSTEIIVASSSTIFEPLSRANSLLAGVNGLDGPFHLRCETATRHCQGRHQRQHRESLHSVSLLVVIPAGRGSGLSPRGRSGPPPVADCSPQRGNQRRCSDRFWEHIHCASGQCFQPHRLLRERRDENDGDVGEAGSNPPEQSDAVQARHSHIRDDHTWLLLPVRHGRPHRLAPFESDHVEAFRRQQLAECLAILNVVIHHRDTRSHVLDRPPVPQR